MWTITCIITIESVMWINHVEYYPNASNTSRRPPPGPNLNVDHKSDWLFVTSLPKYICLTHDTARLLVPLPSHLSLSLSPCPALAPNHFNSIHNPLLSKCKSNCHTKSNCVPLWFWFDSNAVYCHLRFRVFGCYISFFGFHHLVTVLPSGFYGQTKKNDNTMWIERVPGQIWAYRRDGSGMIWLLVVC